MINEHARLDEMVELRREKLATGKDGSKPYVGLEHLGAGCSGIQGTASAAESVSVNSVFEPGDILFGKLRPNLRKCEQVDFGGYCSTDLVVLRARTEIYPRFAAHTLRSTAVFREAVRSAEGTKMPRTSWKAIRAFQAFCPLLPEQRRIAEILDTLDEVIRSTERHIAKLDQAKQGLLHDLLTRGIEDCGQVRPKPTDDSDIYRTSEVGLIPREWDVCLLDDVAVRGSGHTPNKNVPAYWNGGIKWVSLADSSKLDRIYISDTDKEISELGIANSSAVKHGAGTVILSRDAGVGKSAILADEMAVSQHFMAWDCGARLDNRFLYYWLQHSKHRFEAIAMGSTIKTIGLPFFKKLQIALPSLREQRMIADRLIEADATLSMLVIDLAKWVKLRLGIVEDLLTGRVRVNVAEESLL